MRRGPRRRAGQGDGRRDRRPLHPRRRYRTRTTCRSMYSETARALRRLDVLFNNAGISPPDDDSILETELEAWQRVQNVNLKSVFLCCKYGIPYLLERGGGSIINTASFVAVMGAADVPDLLHRIKGRRARHEPRARRAVRPAGSARQRAVSGAGEYPALAGALRQGPGEGRERGWSIYRWAASPRRQRSPTASSSWPPTSRPTSTASTFLVDGGLSGAYVTPE